MGKDAFYFPIVTCIVISVVLSLVSWLIRAVGGDRQADQISSVIQGDPGFPCRFDLVESGMDEYSLTEVRSLRTNLGGFVTDEDQLGPGLSNAEGILLEGLRSANVSSTVSDTATCLEGTCPGGKTGGA